MRITLHKLESLLADESDKIDELRVFSSVSPDVYALLYIAARQDGIEVVDALIAAKNCSKLMTFLIDRVLTKSDTEAMIEAADHLYADPTRDVLDDQFLLLFRAYTDRQRDKLHNENQRRANRFND